MNSAKFISRRLRFREGLCAVAVAVSFFVIIVAVAVSSGFRREIRSGVAQMAGDVRIEPYDNSVLLEHVDGIVKVQPVVYQTGIVKNEDNIQGVVFKGVEALDSLEMSVSIPSGLSRKMGFAPGDLMTVYFVGSKVKVRRFTVASVYDNPVQTDDSFIVMASLRDISRVQDTDARSISEVTLAPSYRTRRMLKDKTAEIGAYVYPAVAVSSADKYPQLFDWLDLIDFNVAAIILLMSIVAGFNMISGLLIMLFRNTSTIGVLKSLGMADKSIASVFLRVASGLLIRGMIAGNALALLFCLVQGRFHLLKLNPENYFVSYVPVSVDPVLIVAADLLAFVLVLLLMLIPTLFISKVDPSRTVRVD